MIYLLVLCYIFVLNVSVLNYLGIYFIQSINIYHMSVNKTHLSVFYKKIFEVNTKITQYFYSWGFMMGNVCIYLCGSQMIL